MLYTEKELLKMIGVDVDNLKYRVGKKDLIIKCARAGLVIEVAEQKQGCPNKYRIIENNLYLSDNEEWVDLVYDKQYMISNYGRVKNKKNGRLVGFENKYDGYHRVWTNNKVNLPIHRGVYFSFHPELFDKEHLFTIDHINGKRDDNRLENLRLLSSAENTQIRDQNQTEIKTIIARLIEKYGYEETKNQLESLL